MKAVLDKVVAQYAGVIAKADKTATVQERIISKPDAEQAARLDLGPAYSVWANAAAPAMPGPNLEAIELIVTPTLPTPKWTMLTRVSSTRG